MPDALASVRLGRQDLYRSDGRGANASVAPETAMRAGGGMTEAEELTVQRFAAIVRGAAKRIPRFLAMREHIFTRLDPAHYLEMLQHIEGGPTPGKAALKWTARSLKVVDDDDGLWTLDCLPRSMRTERESLYQRLHP